MTKNTSLITEKSSLMEMMQEYPETLDVFPKYGIECPGCMLAAYETVGQAAEAHDIDKNSFLEDLNEAIEKNKGN